MRRVFHQIPPWIVVAVSVLGASLILAVVNWGLKSGNPAHHGGKPHTSRESLAEHRSEPPLNSTVRRTADSETPPVPRYSSVTAYSDPPPHLLPRRESESAESVEVSGAIPNLEGASSPRYLESSDAVSVPAPEQASTGRLPTNSSGAVRVRPVPLLPIADQPPRARYADPLPRYGSNIQRFDEMLLAAPVEQKAEPVELSLVNLIDEMFLSPGKKGDTPEPVQRREIAATGDRAPAAAETRIDPALPAPVPLPPIELSGVDLVAPILAAPDVLVRLPPVETRPEGQGDVTGPVFAPLPPVEPRLAEPVAGIAGPALVPLPPVEPMLLPSGESTAMLVTEGHTEPMAAEPEIDLDSEIAEDPGLKSKGSEVLVRRADEEALAAVVGAQNVVRPLPPVERGEEGYDVSKSFAANGGAFETERTGRSWELELIAREADEHSRRGFELAGKKAHFAARLEFTRALRIIAQGLDTEHKTNRHSRALAAGLRSLTEAEDFFPRDGHLEADLDLAVIAGAHRTPVLHESEVQQLTPLAAIQMYHAFAQEQMAAAVDSEVAGSMALCGLGKLYVVIGDQQRGDGIVAARTKAMVLLQAALIASPANYFASNELGVLFARSGRHGEARAAFAHSVAARPTAEGWRNLALTCERLGEIDAAYGAAHQSLALRDRASGKMPLVRDSNYGAVRWVSPAELAGTSGRTQTASTADRAGRAR
jgi:tetratricopeptide (TPR) repeat protein